MKVNKEQFQRHFKADIYDKLTTETRLLKLTGEIVENDKQITVTPRGMYTVSVMMREFFASLNSLREYCIERQI